jgi:hypothetical protein
MKRQRKKKFGSFLSVIGLTYAICTADGIPFELLHRLIGVVVFAFGAWLAEAYDFQDKKQEKDDRREDHDPYHEKISAHPAG